MKISSSVFDQNQKIPAKYTCDGENINPPLNFEDVPESTINLALIVDDPDAPSGDWVHWLVWNMNPDTRTIPENWHDDHVIEGTTSFGKPGYGGPCPHFGTHRYFFKLYALDKMTNLPQSTNKSDLLSAIKGHILGQTELMGIYGRE